ncbi:hypothetical protein GCM10011344_25180 [Dokdonia pacifica]|nr:hypothetical protein GCM10011344_25180 [Dokdonia pacifica]
MGSPGDKYEVEADHMADKVVNKTGSGEAVQKMEGEEEVQQKPLAESVTPLVQKMEASEEEAPVQKMEEEESVQMMEEEEPVQKMEEEEPVQMMEEEEPVQKMEEEEPVQMMEEEEPVQKMEEEEPVQKMEEEEPVQAMEEEEAVQTKCAECGQEKESVQAKCSECEKKKMSKNENEESPLQKSKSQNSTHSKLESSLRKGRGGRKMDPSTLSSMESGFNADFGHVKIHTDSESVQMNKEIGAQAFTHGNDIYFNEGKYNPNSKDGKHLLAHELTHTIQQKGMVQKKVQLKIGDGHDFPPASRFSKNKALEATFDNHRTITNGNKGTHVRRIQEVLIKLGYPLPNFGVDGDFGSETNRAVRAFQTDVGITVDGIVGTNTIDFLDKRDRGAEVNPPIRPVIANAPFNVANAIVQPGAVPSIPLGACDYGLTFPENVQVRVDVINTGATWQPILSEVVGNYSLQQRILPSQTEVTGPGGNTTAANYCAQITELNSLGNCPPTAQWYMQEAVLAHERVHATRFRNALIDPSVITPLETAIEAINIPASLLVNNPTIAELFIRFDPRFIAALRTAQANWLTQILVLVANDHNAGGATDTAEHAIVDPMVRRICRHARRNRWPSCPPVCP